MTAAAHAALRSAQMGRWSEALRAAGEWWAPLATTSSWGETMIRSSWAIGRRAGQRRRRSGQGGGGGGGGGAAGDDLELGRDHDPVELGDRAAGVEAAAAIGEAVVGGEV